jgi:cobyrinic acid a,c-diamide synthase
MAVGDRFDQSDPSVGCLLISSPQGHAGKTIVTLGLCNAFKRKGLAVQPFKKGPDYIDPSWLTLASGRRCRNLDEFLISEGRLLASFSKACQDANLALIEGAMGLYDGFDSAGSGTTASLARLLGAPIILVVSATRMTGSIAAMVSGYQHFEPGVDIAGVILNRVSGSRHERKLRTAVEQHCGIPVVGSIPQDVDFGVDERHLGLIPSPESNDSEAAVDRIGHKLESHLNLDGLLEIARRNKNQILRFPLTRDPIPLPAEGSGEARRSKAGPARIGVLFDRVFNFYYPENLEALKEAGAELIFINSLRDRLPQVKGLYIGGGFPEFFLRELEGNSGLRKDIKEAVEEGLPVYAECAGLMYLCRTISWKGSSSEMTGVLPARVELSQRPKGHGYVIAEVARENPFFPVGLTIRGHEFHHSSLSLLGGIELAYRIDRGQGIDGKGDGIVYKNLFAAYTHLHALATPEWAEAFVSLAARSWKAGTGGYS